MRVGLPSFSFDFIVRRFAVAFPSATSAVEDRITVATDCARDAKSLSSCIDALTPHIRSRKTLHAAVAQHSAQSATWPGRVGVTPGLFAEIPDSESQVVALAAGRSLGLAHARGVRPEQQDASCVAQLPTAHGLLVGIYDGHGNTGDVARQASRIVTQYLDEALASLSDADRRDPSCVRSCIKDAFTSKESTYDRSIPETGIQGALAALGESNASGSTALIAIVLGVDLYVVNLGDSRALLVQKDSVVPLSFDQKPSAEKRAIEKRGGQTLYVRIDEDLVLDRVGEHGDLGVGRALGANRHLAIGRRPQVVHVRIPQEEAQVVLACDGVFDVLSNEDVATITRPALGGNGDAAKSAAEGVLRMAFAKRTPDNMSALVLNCCRAA